MTGPKRIYLDNAATSWPKPETVYEAVDRYQRELGAPAGRSATRDAEQVGRLIDDARRRLAELIGAEEPRRVIFTLNGTDALNLAIHGTLRDGDRVVTSVAEHNSVLRPLRELEATRGIEVVRVGCDADGVVDAKAVGAAITPKTRLVVLTGASNVTGALQPVAEVGRLTRQAGVLFLVDAAQLLGHVGLDVQNVGADLLAAPGHKGLLGPLGTGLLYIGPRAEGSLRSLRQGGTGTHSDDDRQPESLPDKHESGSLNVPGIAGLGASVAYLGRRGIEAVRRHEVQLTARLLEGLDEIDGVGILGPADANRQVGVVSITISGYDPQEVAMTLDHAYGIQVRSGIHCAPRMHRALGTGDGGGTVRFSLGPFTTEREIDAAIRAVAEIASTVG